MGISAAVLDFYDDTDGEGMAKIAMPKSLADLEVHQLTPEERENLDDTSFGLIVLTKHAHVLRKFPLNDPGNAWLSAQYFEQNVEKLAFPARFIAALHIKTACDAYEVPASPKVDAYAVRADDVRDNHFVEGSEAKWLQQKLAQREFIEKQAAVGEIDALIAIPNDHFALVIRQGDGSIIRKYAMPDAEHVKVAEAYFDKYASQLPPEHRHRFASAVVRRAEELDVQLESGGTIEKWAEPTWNSHVHAHLEQRKSLLPHNEKARGILDKLAESLEDTTPADAAAALAVFDQATGLSKHYDRGVTEPYAATMSLSKTAEAWSADIDGRTITEHDLRKIASTKIAGYLGGSFASRFAENPTQIFDSLPDPEKVLIKQMVDGTV